MTPSPDICIAPKAWLGDYICDFSVNTSACLYDLGDCVTYPLQDYSNECITNFIGDRECDDFNNKNHCLWDGGDCCGSEVDKTFCFECLCLDPKFLGSKNKTLQTNDLCKNRNEI